MIKLLRGYYEAKDKQTTRKNRKRNKKYWTKLDFLYEIIIV